MAENGPAPGKTALIIIDMLSRLGFDEGEAMRPAAEAAARRIAALRQRADAAGVPTVYVNDNNGHWHSERSQLVAACLEPESRGAGMARLLEPRNHDYFVIKPKFSGFYATNLPVVLPQMGVNRLILTGIAADICVLFTAADAHMRDYGLWVPGDAVASHDEQRKDWALEIMAHSMDADTRPTDELTLADWIAQGEEVGRSSAEWVVSGR
ncbi:isochorismatase [Aureimonas endophytica]|uniref:Isochorismatase n=1 Tax=Aureimonas endophytica TaxID=2027858 RepID=A0A917E6H5_9HYPH|nr:isochorismatase family cysteine hydrolase [Aureimonas endophytica]GGE09213.1 isochorismatase [Aureimonas endophytica]